MRAIRWPEVVNRDVAQHLGHIIKELLNPFHCRCIYIVKWIDRRDEAMRAKKLATILMGGALSVLLLTFGSIQME